MNTGLLKKAGVLLMAAAVTVGSVWCVGKKSSAAENDLKSIYSSGDVNAEAGVEQTHEFSVEAGKSVYFFIYSQSVADGMISYYKDGTYLESFSINSSDWHQSEGQSDLYYWGDSWKPSADASYKAVFSFKSAVYYDLEVVQKTSEDAQISNTKITLTAGFNHKLSVSNTSDSVKWSTSNKAVATVSSTGVVSAKKNGTATITATLSDKTELKCTVDVKKNVYSRSKQAVSSLPYGKSGVDVYNISYDKKGNIVLKANILNNTQYMATMIKKINIQVKTLDGKTICSYTVKNKKITLKSGGKKYVKYTIAKKNVKIKKADLRNIAVPKVSGMIMYKK